MMKTKYMIQEGKIVKTDEAVDLRRNRPAKINDYKNMIHLLSYVPQANELHFDLPNFFPFQSLKSKIITNPEEQEKYKEEVDAVSKEIKKNSY